MKNHFYFIQGGGDTTYRGGGTGGGGRVNYLKGVVGELKYSIKLKEEEISHLNNSLATQKDRVQQVSCFYYARFDWTLGTEDSSHKGAGKKSYFSCKK